MTLTVNPGIGGVNAAPGPTGIDTSAVVKAPTQVAKGQDLTTPNLPPRGATTPRPGAATGVTPNAVFKPYQRLKADEAAHFAIATDLFNGQVIDARPFSQNNNQTTLFFVKVFNPSTGRTREALFKPREYGDKDGWARTPMEYVTYELNRMLEMDYVPPVAYRRGIDVNFTHYAEGALLYMVPDAHLLGKVKAGEWGISKEAFLSDTRILDVLIQNSDRHGGNFLRGQHWTDGSYRPMLIDHAAGLRRQADVRLDHDNAFMTGPTKVVREQTLKALKALTFDGLKKRVGEFISDHEIRGMLARRDDMVRYFEDSIAKLGRDKVVIS